MKNNIQKAVFATGCFWGVEENFFHTKGVIDTKVGYAGGTKKNPTYEEVSSGKTGHTESVEVTFDPKVISYEELLDIFFQMHDPTTLNRQGPDVGTNYRSAIFYLDENQKKLAEETKVKHLKNLGKEIVTEIKPLDKFWPAEEYHQKYFLKHPNHGCPI